MTKIGPKGPSEWTERDMFSGSNAAGRTTMPKLPDVNKRIAEYVAANVPFPHRVKRLREDPLKKLTEGLHHNNQALGRMGNTQPLKKQRH